jgi:hypothetical protein
MLCNTQAIPVTSFQPVNNTVVVRGSEASRFDNVRGGLFKRKVQDPDMSTIVDKNEEKLLKTWSGWMDEPNNSGGLLTQSLTSQS